ncbi:MAG: MFS transporter [Thermoguttaceae bacterium]
MRTSKKRKTPFYHVSLNLNPMFPNHSVTLLQKHHARRAICWNAFFWGIGNGAIGSAVLIYLIRDICVDLNNVQIQTLIAWILAAPRIAGLLRLITPTLIDWTGNRKYLTIWGYFLAPIILLGIPTLIPRLLQSGRTNSSLLLLVLIWCLYHLIEYIATTALWSWIGDLIPQKIRTRFLGKREAALICGQLIGFLGLGLYSQFVIDRLPSEIPKWKGYGLPHCLGISFLLLSIIPLFFCPHIPKIPESFRLIQRIRELYTPLRSRPFLLLLIFGVLLQIPQGFTQSVQYQFRLFVLGISLFTFLGIQTLTRLGQFGLSPSIGRLLDSWGYKPVFTCSLLAVASGPLFYFFADQSSWYLTIGAAIVWIFWAGINIGLSALVLNLSPPNQKASGIALYYSMTTLGFAVSTLLGGYWADRGRNWILQLPLWNVQLDYAHSCFLGSSLFLLLTLPLFFAVLNSVPKKQID